MPSEEAFRFRYALRNLSTGNIVQICKNISEFQVSNTDHIRIHDGVPLLSTLTSPTRTLDDSNDTVDDDDEDGKIYELQMSFETPRN